MLPPGYPEKLGREDIHGQLLIECTAQASGLLTDCRAVKPVKGATEDFLRWLPGKHCVPARIDGLPFRTKYLIRFRLGAKPAPAKG
jgi:hypothetical protein